MKKKIVLYSILIIVISIFTYSSTNNPRLMYKDIDDVLTSKAYSTLTPVEKKYIMNYYNETGIILPTEENKQDNEPYFNPLYGYYLNLTDEQKENYETIPSPIVSDTKFYTNNAVTGFSKYYNLANISGYNYTSELKDQDELGICWAFAAVEQAESYIMKRNGIVSSAPNAPVFSPRQLDYATSVDGLRDYDNEFRIGMWDGSTTYDRPLGDAGTHLLVANLFAKGVSLFDETKVPFDNDLSTKKEVQDIINFEDSNLELNSSILYERIGSHNSSNSRFWGLSQDSVELQTLISKIKQNIMDYGGVYIETQAPHQTSSCSFSDGTTNDYIIRVDDGCVLDSGHAMQVIGWDDNYTYQYCKTSGGTRHTSPYNCSASNIVSGKGAWILRNSWGEQTPYVHLAYDTYYEAVYVGTDFTNTSERTWDNLYQNKMNVMSYSAYTIKQVEFSKKINTPEKINKIKFLSETQNGKFTISIYSDSKNYNNVKTITTTEKGYVTVDLSNNNIYLKDKDFKVNIRSSSTGFNSFFIPESVIVFTNNLDDDPVIETLTDLTYGYYPAGYNIKFKANTKNMDSLQNITFTLKDRNGVDKTSSLTQINYNKVAANNVNAVIKTGSLPQGVYDLYANYNDGQKSSSHQIKLSLGTIPTMQGDGSEDNPYQITTEDQLRTMSLYKDKSFRLKNDITLTKNWVPIGTEENPFTGNFDGDNYTIKNLYVTADYKNSGLFGYVKALNNKSLTIKNVRFENATVKGSESAGVLIGTITGDAGYDWYTPYSEIHIERVLVVGGTTYSSTGVAGAIIGRIDSTKPQYQGRHSYDIKGLFSSATVSGKNASGLIGEIIASQDSTEPTNIEIQHVENIGTIDLNTLVDDGITPVIGNHSSIFGTAANYMNFYLYNYLSSPLYLGFESNSLYGSINESKQSFTVESGYNTLDSDIYIEDLRDEGAFSNWSNFYDYWELKTVDGISRIPTILGADIEYTNDITGADLEVGDTVTFGDYLNEDYFKRLVIRTISNDSLITVNEIKDPISNHGLDASFTAVQGGFLQIKIVSNYDGYEKMLYYHITGPITEFNVTNGEEITIERGQTHEINTQIVPDETDDNKTITWSSDNPSVATVDEDGLVTTYIKGTAVITGQLENGMSVEITFNVINPIVVDSIIASKEKAILTPNETKTITTLINPTPEGVVPLNWEIEDESIASVNSDGEVTGHNLGTTSLTISAPNGKNTTVEIEVVADTQQFIKGDANSDGEVDIYDVIIALRKCFGYIPLDDEDNSIIDVDTSDEIDVEDVILILRYVFGYIDSL